MKEKSKEENVNYDYCEIETKNIELENSVTKLFLENERLCKEINHVKQVCKEQFDLIKKARVCTKEQSDTSIDKLNLKSTENKELKAQIQDKVFVRTSLKNDLRKIKRKEIVDIAAQKPSANTIVPGMFKLDLVSLAPKLFQNKEAHIDYLNFNDASFLKFFKFNTSSLQEIRPRLAAATIRNTCRFSINTSCDQVEFQRISLTGFCNCTSRLITGASQSRQHASFDVVVKERTTTTAITEGMWGFEHTKARFRDEIIPFMKALKELFNSFDQFLIDELTEVQNVFNQMEQAVEQHCVEKNKFQDKMKIVLKDNE
nr:hypothetical protein [Tanacetum cinerariifolium]